MGDYSFVARMPNESGALHRVVEIIKLHNGNINRISYDRRIDPQTVFFEIGTHAASYQRIINELADIGYLQTSLRFLRYLKCTVYLPHRSGALFDFLTHTTRAGANIAFIDFDDSGAFPERVTISLDIEESSVADDLLNQLKSRYKIEIVEYDTTGEHLDSTVFYVRFAQKLRPLIDDPDDGFLLAFLSDINHIVQELTNRGENPRKIFDSILETGATLNETTGRGFYADVQEFRITDTVHLFCFQLPCGGNVFLLDTPEEQVMVDTGYGVYHTDLVRMMHYYGLAVREKRRFCIVTHADADHCGGAGFYDVPVCMHAGTREIIREANRAYGSRSEECILEEVYTTMINRFSRFNPPSQIRLFPDRGEQMRLGFPILGQLLIGDVEFEVLESLGGHLYGQIFLYSSVHGLIFTADSLMNFDSFTPDRKHYSTLADFLMTSVNVDSDLARRERTMLTNLIRTTAAAQADRGGGCLVCGGHGAVSVFKDNRLEVFGRIERYQVEP